jgi:hypothetical protein
LSEKLPRRFAEGFVAVTIPQLIGNFLEKWARCKAWGGFHSSESLNHCVYSGIEKFSLLMFGWISKVL